MKPTREQTARFRYLESGPLRPEDRAEFSRLWILHFNAAGSALRSMLLASVLALVGFSLSLAALLLS